MIKQDVNGNTVSRDEAALRTSILKMRSGTYRRDSVGRIMLNTRGGGQIVFFEEEELEVSKHIHTNFRRVPN